MVQHHYLLRLVERTGNILAPAYYLTAISLIGFLVITFLHVSTAGKSLKGSYPNVDNEKDRKYYEDNPKKLYGGLKKEKKRRFLKIFEGKAPRRLAFLIN